MTGFDIRSVECLTQEEANRILKTDGPNELPSAKPRSIFAIAAGVIREPMFLLLVAGGITYLLLGDLQEALLLLGICVRGGRYHASPGTQNGECTPVTEELVDPTNKPMRGSAILELYEFNMQGTACSARCRREPNTTPRRHRSSERRASRVREGAA